MLDIVIVNWNSGAQLRSCIDSVIGHGSGVVKRIVVVDNGSADGSDKAVEGVSGVEVLHANTNLGFGKACNLGAKSGDSEFLLFLNPDAAVYPGTLQKALAYIQQPAGSGVGICGVQLLDEAGHVSRSCSRFPSALRFLAHALGLDRVAPSLGQSMAEWDHARTREVDQVMGAFYLVRRQLFRDLGGFDERFFVYFEEVDFALRARQAGWSSVYLAEARAFHAGGGTSRQIKALRLFYSLRSRLLYAFKHFSVLGVTTVLIATLLLEPVSRTALAMARASWLALKETWSAYGLLWVWMPQWVLRGRTH